MSDNEWESVDGWNNGEGEEWSDAEHDIEDMTAKMNNFSDEDDDEDDDENDDEEDEDDDDDLEKVKNTARMLLNDILEETEEIGE